MNEQYARAKEILVEHSEGHAKLAQLLIEREVIMAEDVERIFGKRPWVSRTVELMDAEENTKLSLDAMPECVKQAQAEHEAAVRQAEVGDEANVDTTEDDVETKKQ